MCAVGNTVCSVFDRGSFPMDRVVSTSSPSVVLCRHESYKWLIGKSQILQEIASIPANMFGGPCLLVLSHLSSSAMEPCVQVCSMVLDLVRGTGLKAPFTVYRRTGELSYDSTCLQWEPLLRSWHVLLCAAAVGNCPTWTTEKGRWLDVSEDKENKFCALGLGSSQACHVDNKLEIVLGQITHCVILA